MAKRVFINPSPKDKMAASSNQGAIMQVPTTQTTAAANNADDAGKLILRVALGVTLLFHGISKLIGGIGFVADMLAQAGAPAFLGNLVYVGEVVAPLLMLAGVFTRPAALIVAINMIVAVLLVHTSQFFTINETGGWALELQGMFFFGAVTVALLGAGRFSLGGAGGRFN
jgi:putative oxidoreductase